AAAVPKATDEAKTALIQVLASRPSPQHMTVILGQVNSSNTSVKDASLAALGSIAAPAHLDELLNLLRNHQKPEHLKMIQNAIIAASSQLDSKHKQTGWTLQAIKELNPEKQVYLYDVLAYTGGSTALSNLYGIFQEGNPN